MSNLSHINRKIKTIKTTKKVTEVLKIVSASKFDIYRNLQKRSFPYLKGIYRLFFDFYSDPNHEIRFSNEKLIRTDRSKNTLWVVLGTDIGMCSDFNLKIKNYLSSILNQKLDGLFILGTKLNSLLRKFFPDNIEFSASSEINVSNVNEDILKLGKEVFKVFFTKNYSSLVLIYIKDFQNSIIEKVNILPFTNNYFAHEKKINVKFFYTSLTYPHVIVDLFPRYLECLILSGLIISKLNEHTFRRDLMHNATKNADELLDDYTVTFNKLRQASITQEISEIVVAVKAKKK